MKILHCCLAAFYIDDAGYQENILPKVHKAQGHSVAILASTETYLENRQLGYTEASSYQNKYEIPVTRLPYAGWIPHRIARKLRIYEGLAEAITSFRPDVIFLHDCQFVDIRHVAKYASENPRVRVFVDGHTDFINSARGIISKYVLHGIVYRWCAKRILPYTTKFWGVLPARVDFFSKMYGIPREKTGLLVLGADDSQFDLSNRVMIREKIREKLQISDGGLLIISGGKIDRRKQLDQLVFAVRNINSPSCKLLLFGAPTAELHADFPKLIDHPSIIYVGWQETDRVYDYLLGADLAVFPGTHSVLWEQSTGCGLPALFRRWDGMEHVDVGGNCAFLESGETEEIQQVVSLLLADRAKLERMRQVAITKGVPTFAYSEIAKRAISG